MIHLAYVSTAHLDISPSDINDIEETAQRENARDQITGLLLFNGRNFMQVLEGAPDHVLPLFARIAGDDRHHGVVQILNEPIETRAFPDWSMRVKLVSHAAGDVRKLAQSHDELQKTLPQAVAPRVKAMLLSFNALA